MIFREMGNDRVIRGRFAPSPSGRMHLGNVMSALLAWLSAKAQGGEIVMRIEDIDPDRSRREYAMQIMDDFRFLGLDWDDGPYWQSERTEIYEEILAKLGEQGLTYPCYCSRAELHATQAPHASDGVFVYSGHCRDLTAEQRAELAKTRRAATRIRVPDIAVEYEDGCRGMMRQKLARECGDFILRRSDGAFAYQLAVVADDALMGVTQVVRGSDLISSTPRQIWLHRLLGYEPPQFCHVPLLLAPDGRRLSKRERDMDMGALREKYSAEEIIGKLAWLTGVIEKPEAVSAQELLSGFSWDQVKKTDIFVPDGLF